MATMVQVVCPNPACPHRIVEGENVTREAWDASWLEGNPEYPPYWHSDIVCPSCGMEGIDPESGQLDSVEEELGTRCKFCGVVSHGGVLTNAHADPLTDNLGNRVPRECPHCHEQGAFLEDPHMTRREPLGFTEKAMTKQFDHEVKDALLFCARVAEFLETRASQLDRLHVIPAIAEEKRKMAKTLWDAEVILRNFIAHDDVYQFIKLAGSLGLRSESGREPSDAELDEAARNMQADCEGA